MDIDRDGLKLALNIGAMLLAFIALIQLMNGFASAIAPMNLAFAAIGVQWMPSEGWRFRCAPPFELHHVDQRANGTVRVSWTDAYVPLDHQPDHHPGEAP